MTFVIKPDKRHNRFQDISLAFFIVFWINNILTIKIWVQEMLTSYIVHKTWKDVNLPLLFQLFYYPTAFNFYYDICQNIKRNIRTSAKSRWLKGQNCLQLLFWMPNLELRGASNHFDKVISIYDNTFIFILS